MEPGSFFTTYRIGGTMKRITVLLPDALYSELQEAATAVDEPGWNGGQTTS